MFGQHLVGRMSSDFRRFLCLNFNDLLLRYVKAVRAKTTNQESFGKESILLELSDIPANLDNGEFFRERKNFVTQLFPPGIVLKLATLGIHDDLFLSGEDDDISSPLLLWPVNPAQCFDDEDTAKGDERIQEGIKLHKEKERKR